MLKFFSSALPAMLLISAILGTKVPDVVLDAFDKKFPEASEVKWDKQDDHVFIASFILNELDYQARFTDKGKWQETRIAIEYEKLPEKVQTGFEKNYNPGKVKSVMKSESSSGKVKYVFEVKKLLKSEEVIFSELGKEQAH